MRLSLAARRAGLDRAAISYAQAKPPRSHTPWRRARWCAVDFELTGLDPAADEIISFGAVPIQDGRVQLSAAASGLVRPARNIGEASIPIHGIRDVDLVTAPSLATGIGPLLEAIAGRVPVFHNASVDRPFLKRALREKGLRVRRSFADTEMLGRLWLHERDGKLPRRLALGDLAASLSLPAERPHDALGDALTTAQVFVALATHLDELHPENVGSLARADRRLDAIRTFHHPLQS